MHRYILFVVPNIIILFFVQNVDCLSDNDIMFMFGPIVASGTDIYL